MTEATFMSVLNSFRRLVPGIWHEPESDMTLIIGPNKYKGKVASLIAATLSAPSLQNSVPSSASNKDGTVIAGRTSAGNQLLIYRWSPGIGYVNFPITGYTQGGALNGVCEIAISDDGVWVISASFSGRTIYVYQYDGVSGYTQVYTHNISAYGGAWGICFSPDETKIAITTRGFGAWGNCVRFDFNRETGVLSNEASMGAISGATGWERVDWEGDYILISLGIGTPARVLNAITMALIWTSPHNSPAFWSVDATHIYFSDRTYSWNGSTGTLVNLYTSAGSGVTYFVQTKNRKLLFVNNSSGSNDLFRTEGGVYTSVPNTTAAGLAAYGVLWTNLNH